MNYHFRQQVKYFIPLSKLLLDFGANDPKGGTVKNVTRSCHYR